VCPSREPSRASAWSNSLLASLAVAFFQNGTGAVTESFGNNTVRNNTSNVSGTLTTVSAM
jgi:hypothetical protein